jgi:hypothetical protein
MNPFKDDRIVVGVFALLGILLSIIAILQWLKAGSR